MGELLCFSGGGAEQGGGGDGSAEITGPCTPIIIMPHRHPRASQQQHVEAITGNHQDAMV